MPVQGPAASRRTARPTSPLLRSLAVLATIGLTVAACSSPGASSGWSFGPSLAPAASGGSAAPSAVASSSPAASPSAAPSASPPASASASAGASGSPAGNVTNITIGTKTGAELEFDPDSVTVPSRARVKVTFENRSTLAHNLTFKPPIDAATDPLVAPGSSATAEFTAPAPGDYAWACTIHPGMQGKFTVEPAT